MKINHLSFLTFIRFPYELPLLYLSITPRDHPHSWIIFVFEGDRAWESSKPQIRCPGIKSGVLNLVMYIISGLRILFIKTTNWVSRHQIWRARSCHVYHIWIAHRVHQSHKLGVPASYLACSILSCISYLDFTSCSSKPQIGSPGIK